MREILFRGQRKDNGEWVYGSFVMDATELRIRERQSMHPIWADEFIRRYNFIEEKVEMFEVERETVGQYTGLLDKNGTKIFEGDVVHILGNPMVNDWKDVDYVALIAFLDGGFCALDGTVEDYGFRRYALERMDFSLEVIGNIHDNPELMEVRK